MCQVCNTKFGNIKTEITHRARRHWSTAKSAYDRRYLMQDWDRSSRIYVRFDDSMMGDLTRRQQINALRKIIEQAYPQFTGKLRFSQYAGCTSCPCSPGFIVSERMVDETKKPLEFWINLAVVSEEPEVDMSYVELAAA